MRPLQPDASISLSVTSALVLLWTGKNIFRSQIALDYLNSLDLSSGQALYQTCLAIWPQYDQVIQNRKWMIGRWSDEILEMSDIKQAVVMAAGWGPLGLDLAARFPDCQIFDLDRENMERKANLIKNLPGSPENLHFVTADILDTASCRTALMQSGWSPGQPTLIVAEGISYYIAKSASLDFLSMHSKNSRAIFEYLVAASAIAEDRRSIPGEIFGAIVDHCHLDFPIETWSLEEIIASFRGQTIRHVTMSDIEKLKIEAIKHPARVFPTRASGWIEIADIRL